MRILIPSGLEERFPGRTAHLVGVCGSGMKALAEYLADLGWRVSGSDNEVPAELRRTLRSRGVCVHSGHDEWHVPEDADVIVHSAAVPPTNCERLAAAKLGIPQLAYAEMLGRLTASQNCCVVAGTHGKSTTTAMTSAILSSAGLEPSTIMGALRQSDGRSGWYGRGDWFVVEGCEFRNSFLQLTPRAAAVLNVELDHVDCFGSLDAVQDTFTEFASRIPADGVLVTRSDCGLADRLRERTDAEIITFSPLLNRSGDWWASDVRETRHGTRFRIFCGEAYVTEVCLSSAGTHNVLNAVAAAALSSALGASAAAVREGLQNFSGLRRRMETVGYWRGVTLIDDYAHHPTAVALTLQAVRRRYRNRRIWAAFQPHQISRTEALWDDFVCSLRGVHEVLLVPVYAARESGDDVIERARVTAERLAADIAKTGQQCRFLASLDRLTATLDDAIRPGDVVVTLGAGDITRVPYEFVGRLRRNRAAG